MDYKKYSILATTIILMNACSSSGTTTTNNSINGKLVDSPVAGVTYTCGNITATTDKDGSFECSNFPINFSIGNIELGTVNHIDENGYVTPQDLAGVTKDTYNDNVIKIAQLLQSLDDDGVIEESIKIDQNIIDKVNQVHSTHISIKDITDDELEDLLEVAGNDIVSQEEAIEHLRSHIHTYINGSDDNSPSDYNNHDENKPDSVHPTPAPYATPDPHPTPAPHATPDPHPTPAPYATPDPEPTHTPTTHTTDLKTVYLELINDIRSEGRTCGEYGYMKATDPLAWNDKLYSAAYEHSKDMALSNTFSHTGSGTKSDLTAQELHLTDGSHVGDRIEINGYKNWKRYGENIAAGTSMDEAYEALQAWVKSPGHCKNLMNPKFKEVGMAMYHNADSHYKYYWTQDFGTLK